jgi:hypothetical protein
LSRSELSLAVAKLGALSRGKTPTLCRSFSIEPRKLLANLNEVRVVFGLHLSRVITVERCLDRKNLGSRQDGFDMHGNVVSGLLIAFFSFSACRSSTHRGIPESQNLGVISKIDDLIQVPKAKSSVELKAVARGLTTRTASKVKFTTSKSIKPQFKASLLGEIRDVGGIPRHQQKEMLETLLDPQSEACGGASCARILGIKQDEVDAFLDETYEDVKKSKALLKPELNSTRLLLLGSLKKSGPEAPLAAKKGPKPIIFDMLQKAGAREIHISPNGLNVTVDIKPSDLLRTEKIECFRDLCESTMHIPIKINANVPVTLNSQVKLTYAHKADDVGRLIEQTASVQGQVTPIKIQQILSLAVEFGADFEKSVNTAQRLVVKDVRCKGTLSCELPIASLSAVADKDGLTFTASTKSQAFNAGLVKVSQDSRRFEGKVKYTDIPKTIQQIQKGLVLIKSGIHPEDMDILWEQFSDLRGPM